MEPLYWEYLKHRRLIKNRESTFLRNADGIRVTRLGYFSPDWAIASVGSFLRITETAPMFALLCLTVVGSYALILTKNGVGFILGNIFENLSGHPGWNERTAKFSTPKGWTDIFVEKKNPNRD
jgi:hypothetical protein